MQGRYSDIGSVCFSEATECLERTPESYKYHAEVGTVTNEVFKI